MNKIVIPVILVSITLVAGIFALMPIEKASTVHTTISANVDDQNRAMSWTIEGAAATYTIIPVGDLITGTATLSTIDGTGACEIRAVGGGNDSGPISNIALGTTGVGALAASTGVDLVIETSTATCTLTIFVETAAG